MEHSGNVRTERKGPRIQTSDFSFFLVEGGRGQGGGWVGVCFTILCKDN